MRGHQKKRRHLIDSSEQVGHIRQMKKAVVREFVVKALWDAKVRVWVATSDDVPGLVTESKTFEALLKKLRTLVPELLELNNAMPKSGKASYRVVAERHESAIAAE